PRCSGRRVNLERAPMFLVSRLAACLIAFCSLASFLTSAVAFQPRVRIEPRVKPAPPADNLRADLRVDVPLVLIPVHVTTALGASVINLQREDFRLFEDNVEQSITHFANEDAALSIGLLIDGSGSMGNKMRKSL